MRSDFIDAFMCDIKKNLGDGYNVVTNTVKKNGVDKEAVLVSCAGSNVSSVLYVDDFMRWNGEHWEVTSDINEICDQIKEQNDPEFDMDSLLSKEYVLENAFIQLARADSYDENIVCREFFDMLAVCRVRVNVDDGRCASYVPTKEMLKQIGVSEDFLMAAAFLNICKEEYTIRKVGELLEELGYDEPVEEDDGYMYVVGSNQRYGANVLLNTIMLDKVAQIFGGEMYILPSSIHEVIVVPVDAEKLSYLKEMVRIINLTEVAPEEVLSNSVYYYKEGTEVKRM